MKYYLLSATGLLAILTWCVAWGPTWSWLALGLCALMLTLAVGRRLLRSTQRGIAFIWLGCAALAPVAVRAGNWWFERYVDGQLPAYEAIARTLLARTPETKLVRGPASHVAVAVVGTDRRGAQQVVFSFEGPGRRRLSFSANGQSPVMEGTCPRAIRAHWYWLLACNL